MWMNRPLWNERALALLVSELGPDDGFVRQVLGIDTPRIDGPQKVTGIALYTSDFRFPGMLYAVPVEATHSVQLDRYRSGS